MFAFKTLERRLIVLLVIPVTLFLLAIGVGKYTHLSQKDHLKYPSSDAEAITRCFLQMKDKASTKPWPFILR